MPTWLSPRVRLGVTASVIVVSVCTFLPTAGRTDNDSSPSSVATLDNEPAPRAAATVPYSPSTPRPALPQAVVTALALRPSDSSIDDFPGTGTSRPRAAALTPDMVASMLGLGVSAELAGWNREAWSSLQETQDVFGEFVLAERGIHLEWPGCGDCAPQGPSNLVPWGGIGFPGAASGSPGAAVFLTESGNPLPAEIPGFEPPPPPGGNPTPEPPNEEPRPKPPVIPVPEPSSLTLMSAAWSLMIGATRARKRQH
jgi:hypothetical protein